VNGVWLGGAAVAAAAATLLVLPGDRPASRGRRGQRLRGRGFGLPPPQRWTARYQAVAFLGAAAAVGSAAGAVPGLAVAVLGAALVTVGRQQTREEAAASDSDAWHASLLRLAMAMRSGATLAAGCRIAADGAGDSAPAAVLRRAAGLARVGSDPASALATGPATDVTARHLAAVLRIAGELGLSPVESVARLADVEAASATSRLETRVALAGARATARMLAALPLGGVALAALVGASAPAFLFGTLAGQCCLLLGACAEAAGLLWVQRLVASP